MIATCIVDRNFVGCSVNETSLFALASLSTAGEKDDVEQLSVGDMTLRRRSSDAASNCLRNQAELIIAPYLQDGFSFLGV